MTRWSEEQLAQVLGKKRYGERLTKAPPKYGNTRCMWQEHAFDSERERDAYIAFRTQELASAIRSVIRQVSMALPGTNRRIRIDFLVIENDGAHKWYDAKGYATKDWKLKQAMVEEAYGLKINLI